MILAAFGAIQGNTANLDTVLNAIDGHGIQTIVCTGDCAVGPEPNEVIATLRSRQIHVVQGDIDRMLARLVRNRKRIERSLDPDELAAIEQAYRMCTSANLEWLAGLPHSRSLTIDGETVALFHGTISSPANRLRAEDPDEIFRRQREIVPARVFICGGGTAEFVRRVDDALFVNPGILAPPRSSQVHYHVVSTESEEPEAERFTAPMVSSPEYGA